MFPQFLYLPTFVVLLSGCHGKECHDDGYCDRSGEVPVCRCKQGFNGDGFSCEGNFLLRRNPCEQFINDRTILILVYFSPAEISSDL